MTQATFDRPLPLGQIPVGITGKARCCLLSYCCQFSSPQEMVLVTEKKKKSLFYISLFLSKEKRKLILALKKNGALGTEK